MTAVETPRGSDSLGLRDAHATSRLGAYLSEMWHRRTYVRYSAMNELRQRQVTNVLGNLWHLLNPALTILVFYLIFGVILGATRGVEEGKFILFLTSGLFLFQFSQKSITDGARCILSNKGLIRALRFPRALLPVTSTITELIAALPTFIVLYAVALMSNESPSVRWLLIAPLLALQAIFTLGATMMSARLTVHFADTTQILPFVFRLLLYASGVIFAVDGYVEGDGWKEAIFIANPLFCYISIGRWTVMGGTFETVWLLSGIAWAAATLVIGFAWFRAGESMYARD